MAPHVQHCISSLHITWLPLTEGQLVEGIQTLAQAGSKPTALFAAVGDRVYGPFQPEAAPSVGPCPATGTASAPVERRTVTTLQLQEMVRPCFRGIRRSVMA